MKLTLRIWRQAAANQPGAFKTYELDGVSEDMSFLEMLDLNNEHLLERNEEPVAFDSDCREGICGTCGIVINGRVHGAERGTTVCQLHMRCFRNGDVLTIEPLRAKAFPVQRDLLVDRSAFDKIITSGGYISVNTGAAAEASAVAVDKDTAELAMDAAQCIGCGACVASCPNAAAMLFTSAKVSHLNLLPQGKPEKDKRALSMVRAMDKAGFGNCTNIGECEMECPKEIKLGNIARMNRQFLWAMLSETDAVSEGGN